MLYVNVNGKYKMCQFRVKLSFLGTIFNEKTLKSTKVKKLSQMPIKCVFGSLGFAKLIFELKTTICCIRKKEFALEKADVSLQLEFIHTNLSQQYGYYDYITFGCTISMKIISY